MGSTSFGGEAGKALRELNALRRGNGMRRISTVEILYGGDKPQDVFKLLEELRAKPYKYQATLCDDGSWMVHTEGDVICVAGQGNEEQKAKLIVRALNQ